MSLFSDTSKSSTANPAARPFSRSDYETSPRIGSQVRPMREQEVRDQEETVTIEKIGDFLDLDFRRLFVWLRSGMLLAVVLAMIGAISAVAYALLATPRYTVGTDILINPANLQVVSNDLYSQPGQVDGQVLNTRSKLRVLTSRNVLAHVVDKLDLASDLEFYDPTPRFSVSALLGLKKEVSKPDPKLAALESLEKRVESKADETSFVSTLLVSSESAAKAIEISQAMVNAFQDELAKADSDGANRAAKSLEERLGQLKSDAKAAEEKVEAYKRSHNLSASDGQLVSSQTMTQLNTQIISAQSRVIAAQSTYDSLLAASSNADLSDSVASATIVALREKANNLQRQIDAQSMTFGPRYPAIMRLQAELDGANSQLKVELTRTIENSKTMLDKSRASLTALTAQMDSLKGSVFSDNESQVALRELERDASAKSTIYESFMSRTRQITEREQINTTDVRVISTAVPPSSRSWPPPTTLLIALGLFAGFMLGMMIAVIRGISRDLRHPGQMSSAAYR